MRLKNSEALCVAHAPVNYLTGECASLTMGTGKVKADCDSMAAHILKLGVATPTCIMYLGVAVRVV